MSFFKPEKFEGVAQDHLIKSTMSEFNAVAWRIAKTAH